MLDLRIAVLMLVACGASPPTRDPALTAVGAEAWTRLELGEVRIELPIDALTLVKINWEREGQELELLLSSGAMGTSVERLADQESQAMRALEPEAEVQRTRIAFASVRGLRVHNGVRDVAVAMRNPWRAARLATTGGDVARLLSGEGGVEVVGVRLDTRGWELREARFEAVGYTLRLTRQQVRSVPRATNHWSNGWGLSIQVKRDSTSPNDDIWERITASMR